MKNDELFLQKTPRKLDDAIFDSITQSENCTTE